MSNSAVLPVMSVLTVIACAVGLQLGESAIRQIDPVHFQGPAPRPRDVTRDPPRPQPPSFASAYGWAEGEAARMTDCADCTAWRSRAVDVRLPPVAAEAPPVLASAALDGPGRPGALSDDPPAPAVASPEWRDVSRYVHYRVSEDQEEIAASTDAAAAQGGRDAGLPEGL